MRFETLDKMAILKDEIEDAGINVEMFSISQGQGGDTPLVEALHEEDTLWKRSLSLSVVVCSSAAMRWVRLQLSFAQSPLKKETLVSINDVKILGRSSGNGFRISRIDRTLSSDPKKWAMTSRAYLRKAGGEDNGEASR